MNYTNEKVMNVSLLRGFLNKTLIKEWGILGWTLFMIRHVAFSNNLNFPLTLKINVL